MKKTDTLNLRVTPGFKELVRVAAEQEHRSISSLVEVLVREHCRRQGIDIDALGETESPRNSGGRK